MTYAKRLKRNVVSLIGGMQWTCDDGFVLPLSILKFRCPVSPPDVARGMRRATGGVSAGRADASLLSFLSCLKRSLSKLQRVRPLPETRL